MKKPFINNYGIAPEVSDAVKISDMEVLQTLDGLEKLVKRYLSQGVAVKILGLGTFRVVQWKKRIVGHPRKPKKRVVVPAQPVVRFQASAELKRAVKG